MDLVGVALLAVSILGLGAVDLNVCQWADRYLPLLLLY